MKYSECKSQMIDLEEIGGNREMSLEELMDELIYYRRKNFLKTFLSLETVSHITDAPQVITGIRLQIQLATDGLHMMADQLPGLPIVWLLPNPLVDLAVC